MWGYDLIRGARQWPEPEASAVAGPFALSATRRETTILKILMICFNWI
jgi:hypothetical protein